MAICICSTQVPNNPYPISCRGNRKRNRVSDPHFFFADPDPGKNLHADPDPGKNLNADPDPGGIRRVKGKN